MEAKQRERMRTAQGKLLSIILMIMIPVILYSNVSAWYTSRSVVSGMIKTRENALEHNASVAGEDLETLEEFVRFTANNSRGFCANDQDMLLRSELYRFLQEATVLFRYVDYAAVVSKNGVLIEARKNDLVSMSQVRLIGEELRREAADPGRLPEWDLMMVDGVQYLTYRCVIRTALYCVCTSVDHLISYMDSDEEVSYSLVRAHEPGVGDTPEKEIRLLAAYPVWPVLAGEDIRISAPVTGDLRLQACIARRPLTAGLDWSVRLIVILSLFTFLLLPALYYLVNKWYIKPIMLMTGALQEFHRSGMQYRITEKARLREFAILQQSFNSMADELNESAVRYIEEQEKRQKAQLSMLQTKIHPHTFLNSLTTISNLAAMDQKEKLQAFIDLFSTHMRYMLGNGFHKIRLEEELWFVDNYIGMQNIRSDHSIFVYRTVSEEALKSRVSPFMVYTFVENAVKHSAAAGGWTDIFITAAREGERLNIRVQDNGRGFSAEKLKELNSMTTAGEDDTRHIGIKNMYRILELEYGEQFSMIFSNAEGGGAVVEISVPTE